MPVDGIDAIGQPAGTTRYLATEQCPAITGADIHVVSSTSILVVAIPFW